MAEKAKRNFIWKMYDEEFVKVWDRFKKLSVFQGVKPSEALESLVELTVSETALEIDLIFEPEMLEVLSSEGLASNRQRLSKLRRLNQLNDDNGAPIWYTDGDTICYDKNAVIKFFKR